MTASPLSVASRPHGARRSAHPALLQVFGTLLLVCGAPGCASDGKGAGTEPVGEGDGEPAGVDADADGYAIATDCDDTDPAVHPDATEVCDGVDNDCDGRIDDADPSLDPASTARFYPDADGDGHGVDTGGLEACEAPDGYAPVADDCDDADPLTHPGAAEVCDDGVDNTCDPAVDCDDAACAGAGACVPVVDRILPASGPVGLELAFQIEGSGFGWDTAGAHTVTFDGVPATDVVVEATGTVLAGVAPAATTGGRVEVVVSNANGRATVDGGFTYEDCLYAAAGRGAVAGDLVCIGTTTGQVTVVGPLAVPLTGLAFAPDGTLFGVEASIDDRASLVTVDPATAAVTVVGELVDAGDGTSVHASIPDLTFVGSTLVGWSEESLAGGTDDPVTIDTRTGGVSRLAAVPSPTTQGTGLAADAAGTVYLLENGLTGALFTVDATTGDTTDLGALVDAAATHGSSGGATFWGGQLYSLDCDVGATGACTLVTVDPVTRALSATGFDLPPGLDALAAPTP